MEDTISSFDQTTPGIIRADYKSSVLGNIRGHLAGLQGYDIMALELIQNADDAKAEYVAFDIRENGLIVWNSSAFTYCGEMASKCQLMEKNGYSCDFHRIAEVGSGGKLAKSENIGRFGIGFISTYQITDRPEIHSSGVKLQLIPEEATCLCMRADLPKEAGTTFILPWAKDPNSIARREIGATPVRSKDIEQIQKDFLSVLRGSLLFLRHIKKAEVRRNGKLLLCCDLDRADDPSLMLTFTPENTSESWHIIRGDAKEEAAQLVEEYELLKTYNRSSKFAVALKLTPGFLDTGLLYAFLPTEQSTGLPLHINADFFPESNRKVLIFSGNQHARYWNEMLIAAAAKKLAKDPEALGQLIGEENLWQIAHHAAEISQSKSGYPNCFDTFWEELKASISKSRVAIDSKGQLHLPDQVYLPKGPNFCEIQAAALNQLGIELISERLTPYRNTLSKVGTPILTFDRLVNLLSQNLVSVTGGSSKTDTHMLQQFWVPLWDILETLLPEPVTSSHPYIGNKVIHRLKGLKCVVTENLFIVSMAQAHQSPLSIDASRPTKLFPKLAIASRKIASFPKLSRLFKRLDLELVSKHLDEQISQDGVEDVIQTETSALGALYTLLAYLDEIGSSHEKVYSTLRELPIWCSSKGLIKASKALLPGNFKDPTGNGALLDTSILDSLARQFIAEKLGVKTQSINAFVETVLPTFFGPSGPLDDEKYGLLIRELAGHPDLLDTPSTVKILRSLPILPTQDGGWATPGNVYDKSSRLEKVLGNADHLWLDVSKLPQAQSVQAFVEALGVLHNPAPIHIAERLKGLSEKHHPDTDVKKLSSEAFYTLCELAQGQVGKESIQEALAELKDARCLPSKDDQENWYYPTELYAPYRSEGFESQVHILDFRNTARLNTNLLDDLGITLKPSTNLVISHLQHCIDNNIAPHETTYQILSERAKDNPEVSILRGTRCIYVEQITGFVKPTTVYWSQQQLGRFAYRVPSNLERFNDLFNVIGVKDSPDSKDLIGILLEIITEFYEQSKALVGADRAVYESCLHGIAESFTDGALGSEDLAELKNAPSILNLEDSFRYPDEILLHDSEWLLKFFDGELDPALCKLDPALWSCAEALGVERLSKACFLRLDRVDGETVVEEEVSETLRQRAKIIQRLLHDKPKTVQARIASAFSRLRVQSVDNIYLQATAVIDQQEILAPVCSADAFFDFTKDQLVVTRPFSEASWAPVLTSLLHHLMPEEAGSDITKLTIMFHSLLKMRPEDADTHLTSFGVPLLKTNEEIEKYDLSTKELGELGRGNDEESPEEPTIDDPADKKDRKSIPQADPTSDKAVERQSDGKSSRPQEPPKITENPPASGEESAGPSPVLRPTSQKNTGDFKKTKGRGKHKEQWDRRLLSYVKKQASSSDTDSGDDSGNNHNLAVEVVARQAVCDFEKKRGRMPTQMPQTHPGHDIESIDSETGESRLIEVKGINGEWNQTGVGLSRLQFNNAQKYGDAYWLYVVEFVSDPENIRVHPIQSPASQVTSFMFDGNWREAAVGEAEDPTAEFVEGVQIDHVTLGIGEIIDVKRRGVVKVLTVQFDGKPQPTPNVGINIHKMRILEPKNGDNDS